MKTIISLVVALTCLCGQAAFGRSNTLDDRMLEVHKNVPKLVVVIRKWPFDWALRGERQ